MMKKALVWVIVIAVLFNAVVLKDRAAIGICWAVGILFVVGMIGMMMETPEQREEREKKQRQQAEQRKAKIEQWPPEPYNAAEAAENKKPAAQAVPHTPKMRARSADDILDDVDKLDGIEFEKWCAHLLEKLGYENVTTTASTGDQGVDVIAEYKGMKYAVQCKRYSTLLGNSPIQEVYAGMRYYDCRVAVVMTNSRFTKAARELADKTGVKLWDRYKLKRFLRRLGQP